MTYSIVDIENIVLYCCWVSVTYHQCSSQPPLVTSSRVCQVQGSRADVQDSPQHLGPLVCVAGIPGRHTLRSAVTDRLHGSAFCSFTHSQHFQLPPQMSGTVCWTTSYFLHLSFYLLPPTEDYFV